VNVAFGERGEMGMSWGLTYVLPWPNLDIPSIESAVRHVLAQLPQRERKSELRVCDPDTVLWFVTVYPDEERRWTMLTVDDVDREFRRYDIAEGEALWLEIRFDHYPEDPVWELERKTIFRFDTAWSGNSLASGSAIHVSELLGAYFHVECEPI
jgi:hypothetical protein